MPKRSAGLIMYRRKLHDVEVFLVHPGGPFFANKDAGAWTIPKGEYLEGEHPLEAAKREFHEETGFPVSETFLYLGSIKQAGGKIVSAWASPDRKAMLFEGGRYLNSPRITSRSTVVYARGDKLERQGRPGYLAN